MGCGASILSAASEPEEEDSFSLFRNSMNEHERFMFVLHTRTYYSHY